MTRSVGALSPASTVRMIQFVRQAAAGLLMDQERDSAEPALSRTRSTVAIADVNRSANGGIVRLPLCVD